MIFQIKEATVDKRNKLREHTSQVIAAVIRIHWKTFLFQSNLCTSTQKEDNIDFFP